jgi:elongation factor G
MKEYNSQNIRNIALVSHSSAGKTMLAEAFLHFTKATTRLGRIEDGSTASDFEEEEIRRGISLSTSVIPIEFNQHKINFLDTPGYTDFVGEVISALFVSDGALVLVDAVSGVEVGTELVWGYCDEYKLPRLAIINKMNRDNANFEKALSSLQELSDVRLIPFQLPWGEKEAFKGVIDLLSMKAFEGVGEKEQEIPGDYVDSAEEARMELIEAAAEGEDELLMKYLDGEELSPEEIINGLRSAIHNGNLVPVFVSAGTAEIGMSKILEAVINLMPSPVDYPEITLQGVSGEEEIRAADNSPLAAYVWKTTADPFVGKITYFRVYSGVINSDSRVWNPISSTEERIGNVTIMRGNEQIPIKTIHTGDIAAVPKLSDTSTGHTLCDKGHPLTMAAPQYPSALYRVAVFPETQADSAKISPTLTRICEEDMTLNWEQVRITKQTILQGMGDQHIDVAIRKAKSKFQTNLTVAEPKVPYQETITGKGNAQYRHKKQTGGAGQFADITMEVSAGEEDYEFSWDVFGGVISNNYRPAIEKGIKNVMRDGVLAGYPVHNVKVSVYDGKEHPVDSKPVAFEIAAREAFKLAFKEASPVMLEPIMDVKVIVPEANMGDILGDLNTRRARVQGMSNEKGKSIITAQVPLAEMQRYTADLRSMTGGRGMFAMDFLKYENLPNHLAQEAIAAAQKGKEEEK